MRRENSSLGFTHLGNVIADAMLGRCIVAYLDSFPLSRDLRQARLASPTGMVSLRQRWSSKASVILGCIETQSATGEELRPLFFAERTLLPSMLRPQGGAFMTR